MRLWPRHWHPETWVCSLHGHSTPAADAATLTAADSGLGALLPDGRRLARCLRCDTWIQHPVPVGPQVRFETLPPLAELDKPRRGKVLHEAIVMKLISLNKASHALVFTILSVTLLLLETNLDRLHSFADRVQRAIDGPLSDSGQGASHSWLGRQLAHLLNLKTDTLKVLLVVALLYAVVEWTEAIGLWFERRWAEYLTVIATAGFLPLEIHELTKRVTVLRVVALVVNVALLVWLVRNKRLFGLRGGLAAIHDETDWDAIIAKPTPAGRHRRY